MKEIEFENYKSYLNKNHLYESTLGASFNPSFLLVQPGGFKDETLNRLVFLHEVAHAMLNTTYYGKIIFCVKMIELEYFLFFLNNRQKLFQKNKLIQIKETLNELIKGWVISQEGYATYSDYFHLTQIKDFKNEQILTDLVNFLKTESPYSEGFNLHTKMNSYFPKIGRRLFREFSSIDFIRLWKFNKLDIKTNIKLINPDSILKKSIDKVLLIGRNSFFVLDRAQDTEYLWAQKFISKIDKEFKFIEVTNYKNSINYISDFFMKELEIEDDFKQAFRSRVEEFDKLNQQDYETQFNGDFRQLYLPAQLNENEIKFIGKHPSDFLQKEIQRLYKMNINLVNYFKDPSQDLYDIFNTKKEIKLKPLTEIYRHIFPLHKLRINFNQIEIRCSKIEAQDLIDNFSNLDAKQIVTIDNEEGRYSHWLETVTVVLTLTSASLQIIDILKNWLKIKKEEEKNITIVIQEKEYSIPEDYKLIEGKIEEIEDEEKST